MPNNKPLTDPIYDWIEIFRAGKQTDSTGNTYNWQVSDLEQIVKNYQHVPVVIGHPKTDSPAWGWTSQIRRNGNSLEVKLTDLAAEFVEGVKNRRWPNRSVRLIKKGDNYQLAHIGFLGAAPPAIEGMKKIYTTHNQEFIDIDMTQQKEHSFTESTVDSPNKLENWPEIVKTITNMAAELTELKQFVKKPDGVENSQSGNKEPENDSNYASLSLDYQNLADQLQQERISRKQEQYHHWIQDNINNGKILPASTDGLLNAMLYMSEIPNDSIQFTKPDGQKKKLALIEWFKQFVEKQPQKIELGVESTAFSLPDDDDPLITILKKQHIKEPK